MVIYVKFHSPSEASEHSRLPLGFHMCIPRSLLYATEKQNKTNQHKILERNQLALCYYKMQGMYIYFQVYSYRYIYILGKEHHSSL